MSVLSHGKSVYGDRCSDSSSYKLSKKTIKKTEDTIKTIDKVNDVDILFRSDWIWRVEFKLING